MQVELHMQLTRLLHLKADLEHLRPLGPLSRLMLWSISRQILYLELMTKKALKSPQSSPAKPDGSKTSTG